MYIPPQDFWPKLYTLPLSTRMVIIACTRSTGIGGRGLHCEWVQMLMVQVETIPNVQSPDTPPYYLPNSWEKTVICFLPFLTCTCTRSSYNVAYNYLTCRIEMHDVAQHTVEKSDETLVNYVCGKPNNKT